MRFLRWLFGPWLRPSGYQPDARPAPPRPETCSTAGPHLMTPIRVQHHQVGGLPHTYVLSRCSCGGVSVGILSGTWTLEDVLNQPAGEAAQRLIDSTKPANPGRNP